MTVTANLNDWTVTLSGSHTENMVFSIFLRLLLSLNKKILVMIIQCIANHIYWEGNDLIPGNKGIHSKDVDGESTTYMLKR